MSKISFRPQSKLHTKEVTNIGDKISKFSRQIIKSIIKSFLFGLKSLVSITVLYYFQLSRKFYVRRNKNKVNYIETEHTVIVHLFPQSDQDNFSTACFS